MRQPTMKIMTATLLALSLAACTDGADETAEIQAKITHRAETWDAERAWYQTLTGTSYEAVRTKDGVQRFHHLDINDYLENGELALTPGVTHIDGPAVNNRGPLDAYITANGTIGANAPRPWIDLVVCDGDIYDAPAACQMADRIEVLATPTDIEGEYKVTYRATMPGETEPTISGEFHAFKGVQVSDEASGLSNIP
jgi:hypothetical protein